MFEFSEKLLGAIRVITPKRFQDDRGLFVKTFHEQIFLSQQIKFNLKESFYSVSKKNVIRGMHFQIPDQAHKKIVYAPVGEIRDIILDIRQGSPTYGQHVCVDLNQTNCAMVYIPKGFAHGFVALTDQTMVAYMVDKEHSQAHDQGIHWNSFGADWGVDQPIISSRDQQWQPLADYQTPFVYEQNHEK